MRAAPRRRHALSVVAALALPSLLVVVGLAHAGGQTPQAKTLGELSRSLLASSVEVIPRETLVEAGLRALSRERPCLERSRAGGTLFLRCNAARAEYPWPPPTDKDVVDVLQGALALAYGAEAVPSSTIEHMGRALAATAGDPYTTYISATDIARFTPGRGLSMATVGLGMSPRDPTLVRDIRPGSDAEAQRLTRGDRVLYIDDRPTTGMGYADMLSRLAGPSGSVARLLVRKTSGEEKKILVARSQIPEVRVTSDPLDGEMLSIRVATFSRGVAAEVKQEIYDHQCRGVILDLRQNDGGYIEEGVALLDLFFSTGSLGGTRPREGRSKTEWTAKHDATDLSVPVVILVDGGTASASELVTLVMKERGRALVLGAQTMGKGSVQQNISLPDGGSLRITVAHYTGADGQRLALDGIPPHVFLPPPRSRTVLSGAPAANDPWVQAALDALIHDADARPTTAGLGPTP